MIKSLKTKSLLLPAFFALGLVCILDSSCGKEMDASQQQASDAKGQIEIPSTLGPSAAQLALEEQAGSSQESVGLGLMAAPGGLGLAAPGGVSPTSYVITLAGCASGEAGANGTAGTMHVYLFDTGCLGKLTSFTLNGITYLPTGTGSVPFTSWTAGSTAVFAGSGNLVNIQVVSQLSSPVQSADIISYNFTFINLGTNSSTITVSEAQTLYTAGTYAPNFKINSGGASLTNIVSSGASQGAGVFSFQVICSTGAMTAGQGADSSYNSFCPNLAAGGLFGSGATGVDIGPTYFSYILIADPNGNGTLTLAQAQAAFASGDSTNTLPGAIISGNTGFLAAGLNGPATISANPKMILILQAKNTNATYASNPAFSSYQYFAITLATVAP